MHPRPLFFAFGTLIATPIPDKLAADWFLSQPRER